MKLNKLFLMILLIAGGIFTACDDDDNWKAGPAVTGEGISFGNISTSTSTTLLPDDETVLTFIVNRKNTESSIEIPIEIIQNDSAEGQAIFDIPETIHFNAGEATSELIITFPSAELGATYIFDIAIPTEYQNMYGTCNLRRAVLRDYDWISYEGLISDEFMGTSETEVIIQKADGFPIWRVLKPFYSVFEEDDDLSYTAENITFTVNEDGSVIFKTFKALFNEGYQIYGYWPLDYSDEHSAAAAACTVVDEQNIRLVALYADAIDPYGFYEIELTLVDENITFTQE